MAYRAQLFNPKSLTTTKNIEDALLEFEGVLTEKNFIPVLDNLLDNPGIIELILSGLSDSMPLTIWIIEKFPKNPDAFSSSLASKILRKLSVFFLFPPVSIEEIGSRMTDHYRLVNSAPDVLRILSTMTFGDGDTEADANKRTLGVSKLPKVKAKSQKQAKQARRLAMTRAVDLQPLETFGIAVPHSRQDAESAISSTLATQKFILEYYFKTIRLPEMADAIKATFIPKQQCLQGLKIDIPSILGPPNVSQPTMEAPSAFPMVQPLKSALHFDSAEGFGDWRILISTRADSELRDAHRKDAKMFKIIVKKIKELSMGHFSDDNQKRLNGSSTDIPIFEAKMTRDLRLVYQIDCVSDFNSEVEWQVIKVFGIYTHAQLHNRPWDSIGRQLGKKGKEYRRRCVYRNQPRHSGDNVFKPATFPPLDEADNFASHFALDLPPDDLEQIHSLLVLEKYLPFSQELLYSILADLDVAFPFQVSPQERAIIEHPFSCYVLGRSGTGKTTTMLFKMLWIERTFQLNSVNSLARPRQIFVTKSRVLAGKVEEYFLKLLDSLKTMSKSPQDLIRLSKSKTAADDENLIDIDDDTNWRGNLPEKYSELLDSHFPLFTTFDHLCEMIEADFDPFDRHTHGQREQTRTFVSYDRFLNQYWAHFSQPLIKGLDPALVFSEIMGVIMGSEETIGSSQGYLDRTTYENLSQRGQYTFASQRKILYTIFEVYLAQKTQYCDFDVADRTHHILQVLAKHGLTGQKIDQLYVDEAQDNLLIDALLLRSICHNPNGLFWAGDTAQTISVGSSFRFDDLKAFLFRIEKQKQLNRSDIPPPMQNATQTFQLATNYRSHAGIVNCAHSVIERITKFWPYSIDTLSREIGIVDGLKPVFLNGWDTDNVRYEQFLFGASGSHIEFGAQQCIIVRDELARERLQEQVGQIGLIMTLYESKGLEFNDVLLFNFFEDSNVELSQWRLVLSATDTDQTQIMAVPRFDEIRHAGVCAELKSLYVAITRARKNLWIADRSAKGEPMRLLWTKRNQILNCTPDTDMPRLAMSSSVEEWASKGRELFDRKKYLQAKHCYERATMPREASIAQAYFIREQARKTLSGDTRHLKERRRVAFVLAAEDFLTCAKQAKKFTPAYYRIAGECFEEAADNLRAAEAFLEAREYNIAAKLYRKLGRFDEAVAVIKENEEWMHGDVVENIKDVARLHYFSKEKLKQARTLFSSDEEALDYLEYRDLDVARAKVLESLGRTTEAAELHLAEGRILDAIPLFLRDKSNTYSMGQACKCILQDLWRNLPFGTPAVMNSTVSQLLEWSSSLNMTLLETQARREILMFRAIVSSQQAELGVLGQSFVVAQNRAAALLCLDHYFTNPLSIKALSIYKLVDALRLFLQYVRLLYELAFHNEPCHSASVARLFGFRHLSGDEFFVPPGTFLHHYLTAHGISPETANDGVSIFGWELMQVFHQAVREHLRRRVSEENELCRKSPAFSACLTFVVLGFCHRVPCPQEHSPSTSLTADWHKARIQAHLHQILIYQTLHSIDDATELNRQRRYWLNQLYEVLNPPFYLLGTASNWCGTLNLQQEKGIQVAKDWVRELAYTLDFKPQIPFLTNLMRGVILAVIFDKKEASNYLYRSRFMSTHIRPIQYLRQPDNVEMLPELITSLAGNTKWSLSAGILCIRHIIKFKLPVNISVLCDFVDYLCGSSVVSNVYERHSSFHGITLPRSWLLRHTVTVQPEEVATRAASMCWMLVDPMKVLLEEIQTGEGADYLLFGSQSLSTIPSVRAVFISRICRSLCLLGYNIRIFKLRTSINQALTSLRRVDRIPFLYKQYAYAQSWEELAYAVRTSLVANSMDEMVQLHDLVQGPLPPRTLRGVRFVSYTTMKDLRHQLTTQYLVESSRNISTPDTSSNQDLGSTQPISNGTAIEESSQSTDVSINNVRDDVEDFENLEPAEDVAYGDADIVDMETVISNTSTDMPQVVLKHVVLSEDERKAASVIQSAYARTLLRRHRAPKAGLLAARSRLYLACLHRAQNMAWKQYSYYRLLFLGPLPHILLCLEIALSTTITRKTAVKKRLLLNKHEEYEELGPKLTQLNTLYKRLLKLQKALEPAAELHIRHDLDGLKCCVQETAQLLHNLPFSTTDDLHRDLDIAIKGIVTPKQERTPSKPTLNHDEDDAEYQ